MNSLPLPSASPKAKEPSDDVSETSSMPKQQQQQPATKNSVLDTSAILFENADIEHKYNKEHIADSEFHRGASILSYRSPADLALIPELTGM